jgi:hypothetical protein
MSIKISQLGYAALPLSGGESVVMNQNGVTVTSTLSSVKSYVLSGLSLSASGGSDVSSLSANWQNTYIRLSSISPTPIDWLETYRPLPIESTSQPVQGYISSLSADGTFGEPSYFPSWPSLTYAGEYEGAMSFSEGGDPVTEGGSYKLFYNSLISNWIFEDVVESRLFLGVDDGSLNPFNVSSWYESPVGDNFQLYLTCGGTPGVLGQDLFVNSLSCYKCTRRLPVKWVLIS